MADIKLSTVVGGGAGVELAPDLTYPSSTVTNAGYIRVALNPSVGLITALSLTGKYSITLLRFAQLTTEAVTIKLTVDGVVIWNDPASLPSGTVLRLLGASNGADEVPETIQCNNSLLLEIQTATDAAVNLEYLARPIL